MAANSTNILADTTGTLDVTGTAYKGDGYAGFTDGVHTVAWYLSGFVGRIIIEASLQKDPQAGDWFEVDLDGTGNGYVSWGVIATPVTDNKVYTFTGNYVWVRAKVDRTNHSEGGSLTTGNSGSVSKVLLNH